MNQLDWQATLDAMTKTPLFNPGERNCDAVNLCLALQGAYHKTDMSNVNNVFEWLKDNDIEWDYPTQEHIWRVAPYLEYWRYDELENYWIENNRYSLITREE